MNPLDYKIVDPDAMRYALMNDAGYKKGGKVSGERLFDEQDKGDWFNKKGERKLPQGDKKIRSPLLRPPKGTRFPVTDPKMEKDEDFSKFPIKKVPVEELYSIQNNVREDNLKPERKHGKPIHVVIWKGKYWVVDGNHRASEFWAANEKHIHAHVLNLDEHPDMEKRIFGGEKVKKYAGGGKVEAEPTVDEMRLALDTTPEYAPAVPDVNNLNQPTRGQLQNQIAERGGMLPGQSLADFVQADTARRMQNTMELPEKAMQYATGSSMGLDPMMGSSGVHITPGAMRYAGTQAIEAARPLHEAYMAGELPMVKPASELFTGEKSQSWNKEAAAKAIEMEQAGIDPKIIHAETGVFRLPDEKLRQEISDSSSFLKGTGDYANVLLKRRRALMDAGLKDEGESVYLKDIFYHPELYKAYPELENYKMQFTPIGDTNRGAFHKGSDIIEMNPSLSNEEAKSVLLHEIQHGIQDIEKFAPGADPRNLEKQLIQDHKHGMKSIDVINAEMKKASGTPRYSDLLNERMELIDDLKKRGVLHAEDIQSTAHDMYTRHGGEAESRAVQHRINMPQEELNKTFPEESYKNMKYPSEWKDLIIKKNTGKKIVSNEIERNDKPVASIDEYAGSHRPPSKEYGAPAHDLTKLFPDDVYSKNAAQYYGHGEPALDNKTVSILHKLKDKPDSEVTIYRSVPKNDKIQSINPNDWVTINQDYAKQHGESALQGDYKIISKKVSAKDIFTSGDSIHEFGYDPTVKSGESVAPKLTDQGILPKEERESNLNKYLEGAAIKNRLYHATGDDFSVVDINKASPEGKFGPGFYMTPEPKYANFFANIRSKQGKNAQIMPVHSSVKNPYEISGTQNIPINGIDQNKLKELGYDGVLFRNDAGEVKELVAFEPTQVKSAIGNRGTFDPKDPRINYAKGGSVSIDEMRHELTRNK